MNAEEDLKRSIDQLRDKLNSLIDEVNTSSEKVLELSRQLDGLVIL